VSLLQLLFFKLRKSDIYDITEQIQVLYPVTCTTLHFQLDFAPDVLWWSCFNVSVLWWL